MDDNETNTQIAKSLHLNVEGLDQAGVRAKVLDLLATLDADVSADQDIEDGHVRFSEHVAVMGLAGDMDPEFDDLCDAIAWGNLTAANIVERQGIAIVRARVQ